MRPSSKTFNAIAMAAALVSLAAILDSQPAAKEQVGPLAEGGFLLNSGWKLDPAGKQIPLDTLPMATALSPDRHYLLVLHCGYRPPSIAVIDTDTGAVVSSTPVPDAWLGLAFAPYSSKVYVGGGARGAVFEFTLANGQLTAGRTFQLEEGSLGTSDFVGDVEFSPDGHLLYAAELNRDSVAVINPQSGMVIERIRTGRRPYRILFHPDGKSFFVTHWADGTLGHFDVATGGQLARVPIGAHPTDMVWRAGANAENVEGEPRWAARIFVAATNTNSVYAVGVTEEQRAARGGEHQCLDDAAPAARHVALGLGAERRRPAAVRGLLRRERSRGGGSDGRPQLRQRVHPRRLVSNGGARAALRNAGGA